MQAIKSKGTSLEKKVCKVLWNLNFRFRTNVKDLFGKPDIAIKKYKIVIFIDSCFWHGCDKHCRLPSSNIKYWKEKINKNKQRDIEVTNYYKTKKWKIRRIWEHSLKTNFDKSINQIIKFINGSK
jgi:DNA mismatch endonuclease (patch repair protein)